MNAMQRTTPTSTRGLLCRWVSRQAGTNTTISQTHYSRHRTPWQRSNLMSRPVGSQTVMRCPSGPQSGPQPSLTKPQSTARPSPYYFSSMLTTTRPQVPFLRHRRSLGDALHGSTPFLPPCSQPAFGELNTPVRKKHNRHHLARHRFWLSVGD